MQALADELAAGDAALAGGDWIEARDAYRRVLEQDEHLAAAWSGLGWAAWWLADEPLTFEAIERAFHAHRAAGDLADAASSATWLASSHLNFRGDAAIASGWLERARRLLDGLPEGAEHGYLLLVEADVLSTTGQDPAEVERVAAQAVRLGRALGVTDVEAVGLGQLGNAAIGQGRVDEGLRLLDEASALAATEDFALPLSASWTMCCTLKGCEGIGDFVRAAQWARTMAEGRWVGRHFTAICRSAYGQVLATSGDWSTADGELTAAVDDILASRPALSGPVLVRLGTLRARQGRKAEARELFERAGGIAAAVLALGELDGNPQAAADAAERVLRRAPANSPLERLPALQQLAVAKAALGAVEEADAICAEVTATAEQLGTPYLRAQARLTRARVAGDPQEARRAAEDAVDMFASLEAPYEQARAREALAGALRGLGRTEAADRETAAAARAFAALGIAGPRAHDTLTPREMEVLRLVARGLSNAAVAEQLVLSPHTVHRHMANIRAKLGLSSRAAVAAYAVREQLD